MKNEDYISPPKNINPMVMTPNETVLKELPDKEFKRLILSMFK